MDLHVGVFFPWISTKEWVGGRLTAVFNCIRNWPHTSLHCLCQFYLPSSLASPWLWALPVLCVCAAWWVCHCRACGCIGCDLPFPDKWCQTCRAYFMCFSVCLLWLFRPFAQVLSWGLFSHGALRFRVFWVQVLCWIRVRWCLLCVDSL